MEDPEAWSARRALQPPGKTVMTQPISMPQGVEILGTITPESAEILTQQAVAFVAKLARKFEARRQELMTLRAMRQGAFDSRNSAPTATSASPTAPK